MCSEFLLCKTNLLTNTTVHSIALQERRPQGELQRILGCHHELSAALEDAGQATEDCEDYTFNAGTVR